MIDLLFNRVLEMSLTGSIIVFLIMVLKFVFKRTFSPKWHYLIWMLLIIRLIMPVDFESRLSIMPHINIQNESLANSSLMTITDEEARLSDVDRLNIYDEPTQSRVTRKMSIGLVWLIVSTLLVILKLIMEGMFYFRQKQKQKLCNPMIYSLLDDVKMELGIKKNIDLYIEKSSNIPKVYGLLNPKVILSENVLYRLNETQLRHILLHELSHVKQNDLWINLTRHLLMCIYFFNPIIILGLKRMAVDGEVACDEMVLNTLSKEKQIDYGYTLIDLISQSNKKKNCLSLSLGSKENVIRRIKMISAYKKVKKSTQVASILLTGIISLTCLSVPIVSAEPYNIPKTFHENTVVIFNDEPLKQKEIVIKEELSFIDPLEKGYITSGFGTRRYPNDGIESIHTGIDIAAAKGTEVKASETGVVRYSEYDEEGYGNTIIIEHNENYQTLYAHCDELLVMVGETVEKGQIIATVGNTGRSTGPHLHFEVQKDNAYLDPILVIGNK